MAEQFSWVPLPYCSSPGCPFSIKYLAWSAYVSPWTILFWVLDKSLLLGPCRGPPPSYNTSRMLDFSNLSRTFFLFSSHPEVFLMVWASYNHWIKYLSHTFNSSHPCLVSVLSHGWVFYEKNIYSVRRVWQWEGKRQESQGSPNGGNSLQVSDIFISLKRQEETN